MSEKETCSICLEPPADWCQLYAIPCCGQKFHYKCLRNDNGWQSNGGDTCPACRAKLPKFSFQLFLRLSKRQTCDTKCEKDQNYYGTKMLNIWLTDNCENLWDYSSELLACPSDMFSFSWYSG